MDAPMLSPQMSDAEIHVALMHGKGMKFAIVIQDHRRGDQADAPQAAHRRSDG